MRCVSLTLSLSFTSDVDEFLFLYHLCFSSFYSPCFSLSLPHPLSSRLFTFTTGRGLTLTSARVLVRAHVDGPRSQPTDALDHTSRVSRALVPTLSVLPPHVCHRQETGLSPLARTCSRTWTSLRKNPSSINSSASLTRCTGTVASQRFFFVGSFLSVCKRSLSERDLEAQAFLGYRRAPDWISARTWPFTS